MPAELEGLASIQEVLVQQNKGEEEDEEAKDEDEETNRGMAEGEGFSCLFILFAVVVHLVTATSFSCILKSWSAEAKTQSA